MNLLRIFWIIFYPISAISATLFKQLMTIVGINDQKTLISSQITFLGYALSGLNPYGGVNVVPSTQEKKSSIAYIIAYSVLNLSGNYLCNIGILLCGSGIFQVIHSSVVMNSAIITFAIRRRKMSTLEVLGILIIFSGLASTALPYLSDSGSHVFAGAIFSFIGTFLFSVSYVVDEYLMEHYDYYQINSKDLSLKSGFLSFIMLTVYQQVYLRSNWLDQLGSFQDWTLVIAVMIGQLFADALNNLAYYQAIYNVGAVSTGVIQGIVSIGVFVSSHILFCRIQSFQCLNSLKIIATGIVIGGVVIYSFGKQKQLSAHADKEIKEELSDQDIEDLPVVKINIASERETSSSL